jgi:hypothetical protein
MSSHDTPRVESHQASATHALIIAQASDLVLQACGLGSAQSPDQFSQSQQDEPTPRRRGRPKPGVLDAVVEQLAAVCTAGYALVC